MLKINEIMESNEIDGVVPPITELVHQCQAEIPNCPTDVRGLQ